jgi:hypothetical protein
MKSHLNVVKCACGGSIGNSFLSTGKKRREQLRTARDFDRQAYLDLTWQSLEEMVLVSPMLGR